MLIRREVRRRDGPLDGRRPRFGDRGRVRFSHCCGLSSGLLDRVSNRLRRGTDHCDHEGFTLHCCRDGFGCRAFCGLRRRTLMFVSWPENEGENCRNDSSEKQQPTRNSTRRDDDRRPVEASKEIVRNLTRLLA